MLSTLDISEPDDEVEHLPEKPATLIRQLSPYRDHSHGSSFSTRNVFFIAILFTALVTLLYFGRPLSSHRFDAQSFTRNLSLTYSHVPEIFNYADSVGHVDRVLGIIELQIDMAMIGVNGVIGRALGLEPVQQERLLHGLVELKALVVSPEEATEGFNARMRSGRWQLPFRIRKLVPAYRSPTTIVAPQVYSFTNEDLQQTTLPLLQAASDATERLLNLANHVEWLYSLAGPDCFNCPLSEYLDSVLSAILLDGVWSFPLEHKIVVVSPEYGNINATTTLDLVSSPSMLRVSVRDIISSSLHGFAGLIHSLLAFHEGMQAMNH